MVLETRAVAHPTPIVPSRGSTQRQELSPHNARRQGQPVIWRCGGEAFPYTFNIGVFKSG